MMGKTGFFHRGQNYLIYTSKYLQNIGDFGQKSGTKFSLELCDGNKSVIDDTISC